MPRQKKIIGYIYREWQHMVQGPTNTTADQLQRWLIFIERWEKALNEGKEVLVLGDVNLDFLKWNSSNLPVNDSSTRLKQLNELIFDRIFPHGVRQLVTTPTRLSAVDPPSGLDHIYTNKPDKCSDVQAEIQGGSGAGTPVSVLSSILAESDPRENTKGKTPVRTDLSKVRSS